MIDPEWPRRVAALGQFHVADVANPTLEKSVEHHLRTVLRAREGEEVIVTDGRGAWAFCHVRAYGLERVSDVTIDPPRGETTLYLSPLKGDHAEWAVVKATELGVSRIVPLLAERCNVKMKGEAREKVLSRWRRVAREASGQCRRTYDIAIDEPVAVADVPVSVAVADFGGSGEWGGVTSVAVGPEGGWARGEWDMGRRRLALGPTVLRAETAGVVAAALLAFQAGGWGFTLDQPRNE